MVELIKNERHVKLRPDNKIEVEKIQVEEFDAEEYLRTLNNLRSQRDSVKDNVEEINKVILDLTSVEIQVRDIRDREVAKQKEEVKSAAMSVKAVRYVGLLFLIPFFASIVKGKFYIPWFLYAFLGAGLIFTALPGLAEVLGPVFKVILTVLWSIAMGAIGLNANMRGLFSKDGLRAFAVAFISFMLAIGVFLVGILL